VSERIIQGRPKLPAPEERPALPAPAGYQEDGAGAEDPAEEKPWWRRRMVWAALAILLLLALLAAFCSSSGGGGEDEQGGGGPPVASVSATAAQDQVWTEELTAIGTLEAIQGVEVTTEVAGLVTAIAFRNGSNASAGETLVRLDTTTERAQQAALIAQRNRARLAYERALRLIERGAIAAAEVEQARAEWQNLVAQVRQVGTLIEKKRIDAPFSGQLGIRQVSLGEYISPGTPIVTLQQIAPIYVNFELPENAFPRIRPGLEVELTAGAFARRTFSGRITAINPEISQESRSVTVQATVSNRDRALRPGMFADVTVNLPRQRTVVLVPTTAITRNAYGDIVYVVDQLTPQEIRQQQQEAQQQEEESGGFLSGLFGGGGGDDSKGGASGGDAGAEGEGQAGEGGGEGAEAQRQGPQLIARSVFVEIGETRGLYTEITKGVRAGMRVVTAGQLKLDDKAPIRIVERDALQGAERVPDQP